MYYVYLIYSKKTEIIYKGLTETINRRLKEHNAGLVKSTKNDRPWTLVYYEAFSSKKDARREELFLKTGQGRKRISYLLKDTLKNN